MHIPRRAVLFINLGTPKSPRYRDVARYLNQFLLDKRVIDIPWILRQILVKGMILPKRTFSSAKNYSSIWMEEGSPLMVFSRRFMQKIRPLLEKAGVKPFFAMRYQSPSIEEVTKDILHFAPDELVILPLYPQYASATTGSSIEAFFHAIKRWSFFPHIHIVSHFYTEAFFIEAWTKKVQEALRISPPSSHVLFCFHGLPKRQVIQTNPQKGCFSSGCCSTPSTGASCYVAHCRKTAETIAQKLRLSSDNWSIAFQSRLGKDPWTEPYISDSLQALPNKGIKDVVIVSPSFVSDCIETIEELGQECRSIFMKSGGISCTLVDSLNDDDVWIQGMAHFVQQRFHNHETVGLKRACT